MTNNLCRVSEPCFEEGFEALTRERDSSTPECYSCDSDVKCKTKSLLAATASFFAGWGLALIMDFGLNKFMDPASYPSSNEHVELQSNGQADIAMMVEVEKEDDEDAQAQKRFDTDTFKIMHVGWFTALALTLHNIPEGLLTFVSCLSENPALGPGMAVAIGLHNIPEGFAVAFPIHIGTGSKLKAMMFAGITGLAEPLGAFIGWFMFRNTQNTQSASNKMLFGVLFGVTAGVMTEVAIKSLLLEASRYDPKDRIVSKAWILGAFIIAASLVVIEATSPILPSDNC